MFLRAHPQPGAGATPGSRRRAAGRQQGFSRSGFTLFEMLMVLVLIAILAGMSMPAVQSAFTEQALRADSHQLALMVKTAMIRTAEQHRGYVIDLNSSTMSLHPAGTKPVDADSSSSVDNNDISDTADVNVSANLDPNNQLMQPDPQKVDGWEPVPDNTQWAFEPGELCPTIHVRLERGQAWIELSFNALTGNVENEKSYVP